MFRFFFFLLASCLLLTPLSAEEIPLQTQYKEFVKEFSQPSLTRLITNSVTASDINVLNQELSELRSVSPNDLLLGILAHWLDNHQEFPEKQLRIAEFDDVVIASALFFVHGDSKKGEDLYERLQSIITDEGCLYGPTVADFYLDMAWFFPEQGLPLIERVSELTLDFRYKLATSAWFFRQGYLQKSFMSFFVSLFQMSKPLYFPYFLLFFFLLLLAVTITALVDGFCRFVRFRRLFIHENKETGLLIHHQNPDRFAKFSDHIIRPQLYLFTFLLSCLLCLILFVTTESGNLQRRTLIQVEELLSFIPPVELRAPEQSMNFLLGIKLYREKKEDLAISRLQGISPDSPWHPIALNILSILYYRQQNWSQSQVCFEEMVRKYHHFPSLIALAKIQEKRGDHLSATKNYQKINASNVGQKMLEDFLQKGINTVLTSPQNFVAYSLFFPSFLHLSIILLAFFSIITAGIIAWSHFSGEISQLGIKTCENCGFISCEQCCVTVGLCPRCFAKLPDNLDLQIVINNLLKHRLHNHILLSFPLFGYASLLRRDKPIRAWIIVSTTWFFFGVWLVGMPILLQGASIPLKDGLVPIYNVVVHLFFFVWFITFFHGVISLVSKK